MRETVCMMRDETHDDITRHAVFGEAMRNLPCHASKGGIHLREHVVYFYAIIGSPSASDRKEQLHKAEK